jgi:ribosomal protein S1
MDYSSLEVGQFVNATIDSVNEVKKTVSLSLNDFVKGTLKLEHMADYPIKVIPPKFTQTGKQIKVRVFSVDERQVIFTKKDSLMKHDVPLYKS